MQVLKSLVQPYTLALGPVNGHALMTFHTPVTAVNLSSE
jgi:hypothetical protein